MGWGSIAGAIGGLGYSLYKDHANMSHQDFWNRQNIALQKEFAQNSIKWRVEDAKRAGVHPMAALGINASSFSPVQSVLPQSDVGDWIGNLGQNIDRAVQAGKDKEARAEAQAYTDKVNAMALERMGLENDILRQELASKKAVRQTALQPPAPTPNAQSVPRTNPDFPDGGYAGSIPLFTLARHGNVFIDVVNPDIADSVTESAFKNAQAAMVGEFLAQTGYVKPPEKYLTKEELSLVKQGLLEMRRTAGGWELVKTPQARLKNFHKKYGRTDFPDWIDDLGEKFRAWWNS